MIFDLIITILFVIIFLAQYFSLEIDDDHKIKEMIYYYKSMYGLLSFPWLIFNIPKLELLLTKAKPTGYDKKANCIPAITELEIRLEESRRIGMGRSLIAVEAGD